MALLIVLLIALVCSLSLGENSFYPPGRSYCQTEITTKRRVQSPRTYWAVKLEEWEFNAWGCRCHLLMDKNASTNPQGFTMKTLDAWVHQCRLKCRSKRRDCPLRPTPDDRDAIPLPPGNGVVYPIHMWSGSIALTCNMVTKTCKVVGADEIECPMKDELCLVGPMMLLPPINCDDKVDLLGEKSPMRVAAWRGENSDRLLEYYDIVDADEKNSDIVSTSFFTTEWKDRKFVRGALGRWVEVAPYYTRSSHTEIYKHLKEFYRTLMDNCVSGVMYNRLLQSDPLFMHVEGSTEAEKLSNYLTCGPVSSDDKFSFKPSGITYSSSTSGRKTRSFNYLRISHYPFDRIQDRLYDHYLDITPIARTALCSPIHSETTYLLYKNSSKPIPPHSSSSSRLKFSLYMTGILRFMSYLLLSHLSFLSF